MLRVLLAKDLRRARRNPLPLLINLLIPLCVTALIGLVFGGRSDSGALGRIRFAVVDEDKTVLADLMRGAANQREGGEHLEPIFLERAAAMRLINANEISAVLIIPTNFTRGYLTGADHLSLDLIKNPAQSIHPAVLEELLGAVTTVLNAISRNLQSEFPDWHNVIAGRRDYKDIAALIERAGDKLKRADRFINPPLVSYEKDASNVATNRDSTTNAVAANSKTDKKSNPGSDIFAFLLVGMAGMFLLFLANNAMTDLHRELRLRTLARYHTLQDALAPFVISKIIYAMVVVLLSSGVLFIGGGSIFGVSWRHPLPLSLLATGYAAFTASLMATLVAVNSDERKAHALNTMVSMGIALAGGCMFPPQALPAFLREYLTPWLPTNWFVEAARNLQYSEGPVAWQPTLIRLLALSAALLILAAALFRRQFRTGARP